ncbi:ABC transporter substrate-binding protein [Streptomyces sp. NBC_01485]|uniref:ABC transporter substrate-binding protein n=1 Tax=Streptomyces sp. NBC_01485 TaxID=2903884 RepID=UPI002E381D9B|nr:ABC transporter substrate-binding protein [Streptomyces sp. NBC_01485]
MARNTRVGAPVSRRSALRLGSALAVGAFVLTACSGSGSDDAESATGSHLTTVTFALDYLPGAAHNGLAYAIQKGLFEKEGIKVKILPIGSSAADTLIASGQAQVGFTGSIGSAVTDFASGAPVKSIFMVMPGDPSGLTVLKSSGITSPGKLAGKVYGGYGSPAELALVNAMIKNDGGKSKAKQVVLSVGSTEALKARKVDVAATWPEQEYEFTQSGVKFTKFEPTDYGVAAASGLLLLANNSFLEKSPDVARGLTKALREGYQAAIADPKAANAALAAQFSDINPKLVDYVTASETKDMVNPDGPVGTQSVQKSQAYSDWMIEQGVLAGADGKLLKSFDVKPYVTNDYLPK